jgi:hypothetical protein
MAASLRVATFYDLPGIVLLVGHSDHPVSDGAALLLKLIAAVLTIALCMIEERAADHWFDFEKRARALEEILGFAQYHGRRSKRVFCATNATRAIYFLTLLMWVVCPATRRNIL